MAERPADYAVPGALELPMAETAGLGATIQHATETENFPLLAASLTIMVVVVVGLNRAVWARLYRLAQTRFRMDL